MIKILENFFHNLNQQITFNNYEGKWKGKGFIVTFDNKKSEKVKNITIIKKINYYTYKIVVENNQKLKRKFVGFINKITGELIAYYDQGVVTFYFDNNGQLINSYSGINSDNENESGTLYLCRLKK